jgi:lipopolysaccharide export LptBFGC system permease protein LptF
MGGREVIPPLWAALVPNLAMLGVGIGFFTRVR